MTVPDVRDPCALAHLAGPEMRFHHVFEESVWLTKSAQIIVSLNALKAFGNVSFK